MVHVKESTLMFDLRILNAALANYKGKGEVDKIVLFYVYCKSIVTKYPVVQ